MTRNLDCNLVLDVETTCWQGDPPPRQRSEIIEVGLCLLEVTALTRVERRSILVRPARSTINAGDAVPVQPNSAASVPARAGSCAAMR